MNSALGVEREKGPRVAGGCIRDAGGPEGPGSHFQQDWHRCVSASFMSPDHFSVANCREQMFCFHWIQLDPPLAQTEITQNSPEGQTEPVFSCSPGTEGHSPKWTEPAFINNPIDKPIQIDRTQKSFYAAPSTVVSWQMMGMRWPKSTQTARPKV